MTLWLRDKSSPSFFVAISPLKKQGGCTTLILLNIFFPKLSWRKKEAQTCRPHLLTTTGSEKLRWRVKWRHSPVLVNGHHSPLHGKHVDSTLTGYASGPQQWSYIEHPITKTSSSPTIPLSHLFLFSPPSCSGQGVWRHWFWDLLFLSTLWIPSFRIPNW